MDDDDVAPVLTAAFSGREVTDIESMGPS